MVSARKTSFTGVFMLAGLCAWCCGAAADSLADDLLPRPRHVEAGDRASGLNWRIAEIRLYTPQPDAGTRLEARLHELSLWKGREAAASIALAQGEAFKICLGAQESVPPAAFEIPDAGREEGYRLTIYESGIQVLAETERGLFYGMMTLDQLVEAAELRGLTALPLLDIVDWPALSMRGPHEDYGRDQLPTMEDHKRSIRTAARYKMNTYCWFIEPDHFVYAFDPAISTEYDRFTFDEIRELVAYARDYYIEVIPVVELLAHMEMTLRHDRYRHLSETGDGGGTLCPTSDESFELVRSMIDEIAPAFGARYFHCGLDESQVVGSGRSAAAIQEKGLEKVYADYYTRVNNTVKAHGQTMIMYADIVLNHPGILELLPKDIVMMFWDYAPREHYEGFDKLKEMGFTTMALSGLWDWNNLYPIYPPAFQNMQALAKQTAELGGMGHFVSSWGDGYRGAAGINLSELNHYGFIYCGTVSWNPDALALDDYSRAFARSFFGVDSAPFAEALTRLARCQGDDLAHVAWARRLLHDDVRQRVLEMMGQQDGELSFWNNLKAESEAAHAVFSDTHARRNADYLRSVDLSARMLACAADMALAYRRVAQSTAAPPAGTEEVVPLLNELEARHRALWEEYRQVYAATNRPLNLNHIGAAWNRTSDELAALAADVASRAFPPECTKELLASFTFDGSGSEAWKESGSTGMVLQPVADRPQPEIVEGGPSGAGSFLRLPHGAHLEATDQQHVLDVSYCPLLVEAWVRHNGQREQQYGASIFSYGLGGGFRLGINHKGEVLFTLYGIGETAGTHSIVPPDGQWHHVAVNFHDGRYVDSYVDGKFTERLELRGCPGHPATPLIRVGNEIGLVTPFIGDIDRIRVSRGLFNADELDSTPAP